VSCSSILFLNDTLSQITWTPFRILPVEGDKLRAVGPQPRSESTGGATTSPGGDPPRRRWQIQESGDVGGGGTPGREPELCAVESGKHLHHPDGGSTEFTYVYFYSTWSTMKKTLKSTPCDLCSC